MYDVLKGMTVVEGASFVAGPTCALYLAQLGARVIRFDQIGGGPDHKRWPLAPSGDSLYWENLNRAKLSVGLNLSSKPGRALAQRLATAGDGLFVTNFPAEGFLSYETLSALRPDLLCLRVMGWSDATPAVDYTINASLGIPMMTGPVGDDRPVNHVLPAWDLLTGAYGGLALLAAERDRRGGGGGRELRVSLADMAAASIANLGWVAEALVTGGDRPRVGNDLFGTFGRDFMTLDGERVMVVGITARHWRGLLGVLDLTAPVAALEARLGADFAADEGARYTWRRQLVPLFEAAIAARPLAELAPAFDVAGVTWSRYRTLSDAIANEPRLFADNPVFADVTQPSGATYPVGGAPVRIPQADRRDAAPAHRLGDDTGDVLGELLGMGRQELANLRANGVIG